MKRKVFLLLSAVAVGLVLLGVLAASRSSLGLSRGRCLFANGQCLLIVDNSPIVLFDCSRSGDLYQGLTIGDEILVLHDGVQETYPAHTGAYAVWKLRSGSADDLPQAVLDTLVELGWLASSTLPAQSFDVFVAWANHTEIDTLFPTALNSGKIADNSSERLPLWRVATAQELAIWKDTFSGVLSLQQGYDEVPSFAEITAGMDETFFAQHDVLLAYIPATSCSFRYAVHSVDLNDDTLCVRLQKVLDPEAYDCAMAGWLAAISVEKDALRGVSSFDAELIHPLG